MLPEGQSLLRSLLLSVGANAPFWLLPYVVKDMPAFVAWIGIVGFFAMLLLSILPVQDKLLAPILMIGLGIAWIAAGSVLWYSRAHQSNSQSAAAQTASAPSATSTQSVGQQNAKTINNIFGLPPGVSLQNVAISGFDGNGLMAGDSPNNLAMENVDVGHNGGVGVSLSAATRARLSNTKVHHNAAGGIETRDPAPSKPALRIAMAGGNVFVPEAPGLNDRFTGIAIETRLWNTGKPSVATSWSLVVVPQGHIPVVGQLTKIPETLRLGGEFNSTIIRASDALDVKALTTPASEIPMQGTLLFYLEMPKNLVVDKGTRLELSVKDIYGQETVIKQEVREWIQR